jgi:Domain of unknown function (DUF4383)
MARSRTPAQVLALVFGLWWIFNGVAGFISDGNLATGNVHGAGHLLGLTIAVNGWHSLFHLLSGILGLAVASRAEPARLYALGIGALYLVVASWGLVAGDTALGVVAVDTLGSLVHGAEGLIALTAGLMTPRPAARPAV